MTSYFQPERGPSVISPDGLQRYTEALDSYTELASTLALGNTNGKFAIDAAWESGNIYFCNYDDGYVRKIQFDKTPIASLLLSNPTVLSVIQYSSSMENEVSDPPQEDRGIWVADAGTNKVIRTDNQLNILYEATGISNVLAVIATSDDGCFVVTTTTLIKLDLEGNTLATLALSSFVPSVSSPRLVDVALDVNDNVWILVGDLIYNMSYQSGSIGQNLSAIEPLGSSPDLFSSSSSEDVGENMHVGAIDVDRNSGSSQNLYVTGGNSSRAFVIKYTSGGFVESEETYYDISFPYIIKAVQSYGGEWVYLLEDTAKWDEFEYGSSSSSEGYSSSSSFGYSTSSSSTSSSSSSSFVCETDYLVSGNPDSFRDGVYVFSGYNDGRFYYNNGFYSMYWSLADYRWYIGTTLVTVNAYKVEQPGCPDGLWYDVDYSTTFSVSINESSSSSLDSSSSSSNSSVSGPYTNAAFRAAYDSTYYFGTYPTYPIGGSGSQIDKWGQISGPSGVMAEITQAQAESGAGLWGDINTEGDTGSGTDNYLLIYRSQEDEITIKSDTYNVTSGTQFAGDFTLYRGEITGYSTATGDGAYDTNVSVSLYDPLTNSQKVNWSFKSTGPSYFYVILTWEHVNIP